LLGVHRGRRIDDEDDQVADLALADFLAKVATLQHQPFTVLPAPLALQWCGGAHGGVDREVVHLFLRLRAYVAAAPVGGLARGALASLLAHAALTWEVAAPQVERL